MKKKINLYFSLVTAAAILATLLLSLFVSYDVIENQVTEEIRSYAYMIRNIYNSGDMIDWEGFGASQEDVRITVVEKDGSVIYDNLADREMMDNHGQRKEIVEALGSGEGFAVRNSDTLSENLFYYAVKTNDGKVIRVAKQTSNILGLFGRIIPVLIGVAALLFIACAVIARKITDRLVSPIVDVSHHMDDIESVEIYDELRPFMETIRKQHEDILRNATMRQDFTANVTHELKTPLTSISGYAELMENKLVDEDNIVNFASAIHKNADRLLTLINDIIRLSELDYMQTEPEFDDVDLFSAVQSSVRLLELNAASHDVTVRTGGSAQIIHANKQMLEELIYNLCDNAIRYNKPGGTVEVTVYRDRRGAVLSVKDDGIGIPKEHQTRIFERFYRVDKSRSKERGGTGLGLAIVKHIAQVHGASLEVISEPGAGTQIIVIFR